MINPKKRREVLKVVGASGMASSFIGTATAAGKNANTDKSIKFADLQVIGEFESEDGGQLDNRERCTDIFPTYEIAMDTFISKSKELEEKLDFDEYNIGTNSQNNQSIKQTSNPISPVSSSKHVVTKTIDGVRPIRKSTIRTPQKFGKLKINTRNNNTINVNYRGDSKLVPENEQEEISARIPSVQVRTNDSDKPFKHAALDLTLRVRNYGDLNYHKLHE